MHASVSHDAAIVRGCAFLATLLIALGVARADDGRNFTGFYDVTDRVEAEGRCSFTFAADVWNMSGSDLQSASLRLMNPADLEHPLAHFADVSIADRGVVRISADMELPCEELDRWERGLPPSLGVEDRLDGIVDLVRGALSEVLP